MSCLKVISTSCNSFSCFLQAELISFPSFLGLIYARRKEVSRLNLQRRFCYAGKVATCILYMHEKYRIGCWRPQCQYRYTRETLNFHVSEFSAKKICYLTEKIKKFR